VSVGLVLALALVGCSVSAASDSPSAAQPSGPDLRYVALGDSYTIGTSVEMSERFPNQLVAALGRDEPTLRLVANLGVNGYTSADLMGKELPALDALEPEFVTVLIGVNDVVQGVPIDTYRANVVTILDALLHRLPVDRIVTVAVPDYTVTPSGADYGDPRRQHDGIVATNDLMGQLSKERGIVFIDIFDLSLRAADDRSFVASDGLHPSGAQYGLWVERLVPVVRRLLGH
jgi:acyl-CoA thioesterase-1